MNAWTVTSPNGRTITEPMTPQFVRVLRQEGWTVKGMGTVPRPIIPPSVAEWQAAHPDGI